MAILQQARATYELRKYLQLSHGEEALLLVGDTALRDSLNDRVELTIVHLSVQGAFLVLNNANSLHFVAGGHRVDADDTPSRVLFDSGDSAWLHISEADRPIWISLFQDIIEINACEPRSASERAFSIPALQRDPRTSKLSVASQPVQLSFLAGVPLTSKNGYNIGAICVVNRTERPPLSASEADILSDSARRCVDILDVARERGLYNRWTAVQEELDNFLEARSLHAQVLRVPHTYIGRKCSAQDKNADRTDEHGAKRVNPATLANGALAEMNDPTFEGGESAELAKAEVQRSHRFAKRDNATDARPSTAKPSKDDDRGLPKGETIYRKVFRRAAECLRSALKADGVLFIDGLIGFHGDIQPVTESEQELEREMVRPLVNHDQSAQGRSLATNDWSDTPEATFKPRESDPPGTHSRIYTSAEYLKGVHVERPAEVLGISGSDHVLKLARISESTIGLLGIDEGFLQRLMDRHPEGAVWFCSDSTLMQAKDGTIVEVDLQEEAHRLTSTFKNVKQLIFKPLTDPTSLKRMGACFAWRTRSVPLFTDAFDLRSLKTFLHVVESDIARYDASSAAKQKESFVSSVSHELRTPLHGILGAAQLLDESGLDPMQNSLAEMIITCGSTLHETLTSVLNYAKINQFERRQHEYRHRRPPDSVWALSNKRGLASGPDRDYEGLYICTNVAMICEEILGVLEAGKSFHNSNGNDVIVVCNIEYQENWNYYIEPGALRQIMVNLIGNALKYTKSGSVVVTLSATRLIKDTQRISNDLTSGRTLRFKIRDTGSGMSKDFMENQLFLPFTQEDSTSSHGVGLGMSIVKSLISLLSGEIQVQSKENEGTEITVQIPMRMCSPDDDEKGRAALEFESNIRTIRDRKLSAVIYGFPRYVRDSLRDYLCDWYNCTLLEPTREARPDIIMVDEGNEKVLEAVKETAQAYGKHGVLLSIVMVPSRLGKRMNTIDGYIKWERVPRPVGPKNVARGLLSCLEKLDELRKYGGNASVGKEETEEKPKNGDIVSESEKENSPGIQHMPRLRKLQIAEASQKSVSCSDLSEPLPGRSKPSTNEEQKAAAEQVPSNSVGQKIDPKLKPPGNIRILLVDDNMLNLKLLGAFFKKNGYSNTKEAKHGREAVEAAHNCSEGFDIIFMDLSMPIMNGFEATRQIRKMEAGCERAPTAREPVIIALTGLASQEDEEEAFNAGVDLFVTKPMHFPKLSNLLRQYEEGTLRKRRRSEEKRLRLP
ncbi:sensor histidine kinase response regulator (hsp90-like protein) [Paraphaeosphaeria sporulosa]